MKIYPKLDSRHVDKHGKRAIIIFISEGQKRRQVQVGYKVKEEHFDAFTGLVSPGEMNHRNINSVIRAKIGEIEAKRLNSVVTGEEFISDRVVSRSLSFADFCQREADNNKVAAGTRRRYKMELGKIRDFDAKSTSSQITSEWVNNYKLHLQRVHPGKSALHNSFKFLKKMVKAARRDGLIEKDVFGHIDMPKEPKTGKIRYLEMPELAKLEEFAGSPAGVPYRAAALWQLYGCYSGLRYSDWSLKNMAAWLNAGQIQVVQTKTSGAVAIPLYPKLRNIMQLLLGINVPPLTNQQHNLTCKSLAPLAGIDKKITSHFGRHTFGVYLAEKDVPPQVAMKLLGHKNIRETMIYYEITDKKVADTVAKMLG